MVFLSRHVASANANAHDNTAENNGDNDDDSNDREFHVVVIIDELVVAFIFVPGFAYLFILANVIPDGSLDTLGEIFIEDENELLSTVSVFVDETILVGPGSCESSCLGVILLSLRIPELATDSRLQLLVDDELVGAVLEEVDSMFLIQFLFISNKCSSPWAWES